MSSSFEMVLETGVSPRLPVLKEGRNSLVSPTQVVQTPSTRDRASEWALDVRSRINACIQENINIEEDDVIKLKQQLVTVFINALQQDSRTSWVYLHEVLGLVEPFKEYFDLFNKKDELFHYLERLVCYLDAHNQQLFDLQILEALNKVFPSEIAKLNRSGAHPAKSYTAVPVSRLSNHPPSPRKSAAVHHFLLPDGTNPYSTCVPDEEPQYAYMKPMTFGDLRRSVADVASEVAARECIWNQSCGTITQALKTDIPDSEPSPKSKMSPTLSQSSLTSSSTSSISSKKKTPRTPRVEEEVVPKLNGREAVEYFAKCHHTGHIKSLYFNVVPNRHYQPYELMSVAENKANPEHYVFSTFGVLHMYPDQPAESLTLAEWQREAVLWTAASSIPFFKKFLIMKMFNRWRDNKLHLDFLRRRMAISVSLLQAVPAFGTALLQVTRLLKELWSVKFLPFESDKTFTLGEFENYVNYKNIQAEKVLDRFFRYCKLVVDVTAEESFKKMRHCEEQVRKKSLFTKDSLHMQKVKKAQREENLRRARSETGRLGNFVKLVDQVIIEHMFSITKSQVLAFVQEVLKPGVDIQREGFFKANLVFTKQDILGISPSREKFMRALNNTLKSIPSVLCDNAIPIDGSLKEQDVVPEDTESSVPTKSEAAKSVDLKTISDRRKSTAATMSSMKQGSHTHISDTDKFTVTSQAGETIGDQESQIGTTKSTIGEEATQIPELLKQETMSKSDDEMGVATPDLVVPDETAPLLVAGEGFMGQYEPLSKASLQEKLEKDAQFQEALKFQTELMFEALEDVEQYCDYNKWLNEIQQFCRKWTERSVRDFRGVAAFTIEQKLTELRQWSEKVRNFDRNFITENGLFYIDCSAIHDVLLPRLNDIYHELVTFVADEGRNLAKCFCDEMKTIFENMKDKRPTVNAFALFAKNFSLYKKNTPQYQQRVEYIKSLYEVIRMSFRQLTPEEEKYEENVWAAWEAFLLQMQDASEFVNTQTPLMTQLLEDTYQGLERTAIELSEKATSGKFLDPTQKPTQILIEMRKIREKFYDIQEQLQQASKWRDAICGEPYDLKFLNNMTMKMDVRQELWKYVEISTHAIKDWKQMLFKKMNIKKALEKLVEWQAAAGQLKPYLPSGDQVLNTWFQSLQDFKKDLPLLHKLANDALKERHWKAIFLGMNEAYDPNKRFTVSDLLSYDLEEHSQLIHTVHLGSLAEYDLELKIHHIRKFWEEREFKLAKHIPDSLFTRKEPIKKPLSPSRRRTKLQKYRQERAAAAQTRPPQGLNVSDDDLFILIEVEELKFQIEDSRISVKAMIQSPHLGDQRQEVEYWNSALQQVEEITDLWFLCQKKWLYLLKVFEKPELYKKFSRLSQKFEVMHNKLKDWMRVACNDSKVMTVVNRKRGEKGYRLLQGDNLRALILSLIQMQDEIIKHLENLLESTRMEFPRLYFLSNEDLVELLAVSRYPKALLPVARKCFPGIQSLVFALPSDIGSLNTPLDFELNADKLQVVSMCGQYKEEVPLFVRVEAYSQATRWLRALENIMKNTVAIVLQGCVQARMEEGSRQPIHLLEELAKYNRTSSVHKEEITSEIKHQFRHWLLRFPVQCVLVAEGIVWERSVNRCIEREDTVSQSEELKMLRMNICSKLDQYIDLLQESLSSGGLPGDVKDRLHIMLCSLIKQTVYHRDIMDSMLMTGDIRDSSFEWLRVLKYHMDVRNVLRAKTESVEIAMQAQLHTSRKPAKSRRASQPAKSRTEQSLEDPPALSRTKTTVSTDYQFSLCHIQQMGNVFSYDYEYLGPTKRLVLTPLTERAFLSLTQALKNFHSGTLVGPPCTGKSETIKELAKFFGQNMFTINCNEDITLPMLVQYMLGMVQAGSWTLFDDTDRLKKGLMSVAAQHLDYLHTAFRALDLSSENQYKIRGQPRFDKKMGVGDKVIRRNSLTTLHTLPTGPQMERQKTVPHGFNEEGLVTYFEDTWIAEKDQRRHSIEREVEIKESDLYKTNRPPPLFYEHIKSKGRKSPPDYSCLLLETIYMHRILGNLMFNGKLIQASANYGCFMTLNTANNTYVKIPETFRLLMRPCAMVVPDLQMIMTMILCCHGFKFQKEWAKNLTYFLKLMKMQMPRKTSYEVNVKDMKKVLFIAVAKMRDVNFLEELRGNDGDSSRQSDPPQTDSDLRSLEEHCIVQGLQEILLPVMDEDDDRNMLLSIMRDVFPLSSRPGQHGYHGYDPKLVKSIKDQLRENNLKESPEVMNKILQLYSAINLKQGVVMAGPSGSGKTTCCQTLAQAINKLNYLLFAPDHSKDELTTDKDFIFHTKHKFKFLMTLETPRDLAKRRPQKMGTALTKVNESINELETTPQQKMRDCAEHPKVDIIRLNPTALSPQEFLGTFQDGVWKGGLFPKVLKDACYLSEAVKTYLQNFKDKKISNKIQQESPSVLLQWVVLDGIMHPCWTESLNTLLDEERKLSLANGGRVCLQDTTALLFETCDLRDVSPATLSRCTVVHFSGETVHWRLLYDCWSRTAKSKWVITTACLRVMDDLVKDVFGPTIKFLRSDCCTALLTDVGQSVALANEVAPGIQEVTSFLKILSALLDRGFLRDDFEKKLKAEAEAGAEALPESSRIGPSRQANSRMTSSSQIEQTIPYYMEVMKGIFAFAFIWGFGGHIHERYSEKFSKFAHDVLYRATHPVRIPVGGAVFDYCLEESSGNFIKWSEKQPERLKVLAGGYAITPEVERYTYLIDLMLGAQQPVLLSGIPGVGKSAMVQTMVTHKQPSTSVSMSPGLTSAMFQNKIMSHVLDLKHKALSVVSAPGTSVPSGPKIKQRHLFFIDDLNTAHGNGGYQPPLELLRQILTQGGTYEKQRQEFQDMEEAMFLAATTIPTVAGSGLGQSCHIMSSRLTRLFLNLTVFTPSPKGLLTMYGRNLQNWLEEFPTYSVEHHYEFARSMTLGLLELYHRIKEKCRPTPAHAHYIFSLHDVGRVIQGIMLMSPRSKTRKMLRRRKGEKDDRSKASSRKTSVDSSSRTISVGSNADFMEGGPSAPMMKNIGQLWCHECCRTFADRLISEDDLSWFGRVLEEIAVKYFCLPREDPRAEMAAISEETFSQAGRGTPRSLTSPPLTPESDLDLEEQELIRDETIRDTIGDLTDEPRMSSRGKSRQSHEAFPQGQSTERSDVVSGEQSTTAASTVIDVLMETGELIETSLERVPNSGEVVRTRTTSEMESEMTEESEDSTDGETSATETDTVGTPAANTRNRHATILKHTDTSRSTPGSTEHEDSTTDWQKDGKKWLPESGRSSRESPTGVTGKSSGTPNLKRQSSRALKRAVTFKPGLHTDWEHEAYFGPLMTIEELKSNTEALTSFIYTKFFMASYTESQNLQVEKGYVESSEEVLTEALQACLTAYNAGTSQRLELVFFSEAIKHAARLSRILAIPGGHALLLGMSYSTGRATLVRLAAYVAHCKLYEPKPQINAKKNLRVVREHIKRCCYHAGILGKPIVLLIHEDLGTECLQDICCLMAQGTSPGLYNDDEMQAITSMMMPGGVQTKRIDKIEQAFERFIKKVRQNLHVVVCLNYRGNSFSADFHSLHTKVCRYPGLVKNSNSVDLYTPWSHEAYIRMAEVWLQDQRSKIRIPWHPTRQQEQITLTSKAMAYMHLSAKRMVERQFCHQMEPLRFYSPLTFMEFIHLMRVVTALIVKKESQRIRQHEKALGKVDEAFDSIAAYKREVSDLVPQQKMAVQEIKDLVDQVEEQKLQYIEALDRCKGQEQLIVQLQGPLEELRKEAQTEFDKVNPNYQAALEALAALEKKSFDEVRSYSQPPPLVQFVVNALCLLFKRPQDWTNGKLLLIKENFVQDLVFYDKDNMPDKIFNELKTFIFHPNFKPELIAKVSKAAESVCIWIHAVYKYADIHRNMQPRLKNLLEHEEKFTLAQAKLGHLRVEASRIKSALERKITLHKSAVKRAKTIERHIQTIEKRIARAMNLMEHMSMQHYLWKSELRKARHHVITAPGDALVMAACVCYHGPLDDKSREELMQDWLERCRQGNFTLSKHIGQDVYPLNTNLDGLFEGHRDKDSSSEVTTSETGDTSMSESSVSGIPILPEIRVFKYPPALYDTSKYYKSELEKEGSMEYDTPNVEGDDSDDEEEHSALMNRNGFSLQDILSDFDELSKWRMDSLPTDLHSVQNALLMRVSCFNRKHCWPLLIDPDNQAELWVKALQTSKNLFAEKDVREGTPDEPEGIPLESSNDKDSQILSLAPSRGTGFTFSDMASIYQVMDDAEPTLTSTTMTTYTATDYSKATGMSMDRQSRQTWNSEELRPVTSVTNSWETYSLRVEPSIEHPQHNLWIIEADDPHLDSRLINAIVHGVTVLVTHLERKPLDPLFRGLLLKQFFVDKDGNRIIKVGSYEFRYHPNFCLYLSTSIPLFLKGDGLHNIPLHRMCIINMAMSDEAIINRLLLETMKVERKEFEGQKRSNENDIILHRQRLARENEIIREKTLNLDVPLLEDMTMLQALITSKNEVEKNRMILEETRYMGDHLEEKFAHYMPMITDAAVLYNMAKRMAVLHPYYYLPFYKFVEMYSTVIKSRDRGKGSSGAPNARAQELTDATLSAIFKYLSMMMFEKHYTLLQFLFTMEHMKMTRKASNKELSILVNGFDKKGLDEATLLEHRPPFLENQAWIDCLVLEQLHHPFHGLRRSLLQNIASWEEYFKHPIALMNPVPGSTLQELTVFQKCVLWKLCSPHRADEMMNALILHELGNMQTCPDHYNIREIYRYTDKTTPVIFLIPSSDQDKQESLDGTRGMTYVNPAHEVKRLAKEVGMEGRVRVMNFGVVGLMSEVKQALEDCLQSGYWLLLQNYHLAEEPLQNYFDLLKGIVYSKWSQDTDREDSDVSDDGASLVTRSRPSHHSKGEININNTFRLWITTKTNGGRLVPGVLVQHGLKVTVEYTKNFKSTLQKAYRSVAFLLNKFSSAEDEEKEQCVHIMPLAVLHALLLQQSYYGSNAFKQHSHWSLTDLAMAVEVFKKVKWLSGSVQGMMDSVSQVYANHCVDMMDAGVVRQIVSTLAQYGIQGNKQKLEENCELEVLLNQLLDKRESFCLSRSVESLVEMSAKTFCLPQAADHDLMAMTSRILSKDMIQVIGAPELFLRITATPSPSFLSEENIVSQIISALQLCPPMPETSRNQVIPLDLFFHYEIEGFRNLLQTIQSDLSLLQRKSRGEILPGSNLDDVAFALNRGRVPNSWTSCTFPSGTDLMDWINNLPVRSQMLLSYVGHCPPSVFSLSVFLRPDKFLEAVKQTYARKQFQGLESIDLEVQVMPSGLQPSVSPADGVFLSGLTLHNALWDTTGSVLISGTDDGIEQQSMPILWLKPFDTSKPHRTGIRNKLYMCPLFCSTDPQQHKCSNIVTHFPLPSLTNTGLWLQKRTFLSSSLY